MLEDEYTVSLLHFDGADESTTFTDESGKTWTHAGSANIETTAPKLGTASVEFLGDGGVHTVEHEDFVFGNGDFSIDFWIKITGTSDNMMPLTKALNGNNYAPFAVYKSNGSLALGFHASSDNLSWDLCNGVTIGTLVSGVWSHVAICRSGTNVYCFLDGAIGSTTAIGTATLLANGQPTRIGSDGTFYHATCFIDEFRISKGVARWVSDFTPPIIAYEWDNTSEITLPLLLLEI